MPILDVDHARTVIVIKRSLSPGFAGIPNPLFANDNTPSCTSATANKPSATSWPPSKNSNPDAPTSALTPALSRERSDGQQEGSADHRVGHRVGFGAYRPKAVQSSSLTSVILVLNLVILVGMEPSLG